MPRSKTYGNHLGRRPALNYLRFPFSICIYKMVLTAVLDSNYKAHIIKTHTKMRLSLQSLFPDFCVLKTLIMQFQKSDYLQMEFRKQCKRGKKGEIPNRKKVTSLGTVENTTCHVPHTAFKKVFVFYILRKSSEESFESHKLQELCSSCPSRCLVNVVRALQ